ncbi:MAG: hypothetical protein IKQ94_10710 [Bacteroidales bacterium]|nr:hypothetical protein [Bacteroidales bacterium]
MQSLLDVALQWCGTADAALDIALANAIPVDYTFIEAQEITIPDSVYKPQSIIPCTGETTQYMQ